MNLNSLCILTDNAPDYFTETPSGDIYHTSFSNLSSRNITVYFNNLESSVIKLIEKADFIVGCVAWLTNDKIITALSKLPEGASIIVQKEDFLRPDLSNRKDWTTWLRRKYDAIVTTMIRRYIPVICRYQGSIEQYQKVGVRCMGHYNLDKTPAFPRMHNKFLVFARVTENGITPYGVWTGSFNFSYNSGNSLENAIYIEDSRIAQRYYDEWAWIFGLSEELDWTSRWACPEFHI